MIKIKTTVRKLMTDTISWMMIKRTKMRKTKSMKTEKNRKVCEINKLLFTIITV